MDIYFARFLGKILELYACVFAETDYLVLVYYKRNATVFFGLNNIPRRNLMRGAEACEGFVSGFFDLGRSYQDLDILALHLRLVGTCHL